MRLHTVFRRMVYYFLGRVGLAFLVFLAAFVALDLWAPRSSFHFVAELGLLVTGVWLAVRFLRMAARQAIWRLRNRLLVTYLFIAVVPLVLAAVLTLYGGQYLVGQIAVYLVTSELDRKADALQWIAGNLAHIDPLLYRDRFPGLEALWRRSGREVRYPADSTLPAPRQGWESTRGVLVRDSRVYLWSYSKTPDGDVTVAAPLGRELLAGLAPGLGLIRVEDPSHTLLGFGGTRTPAASRFDKEVIWWASPHAADWNNPGQLLDGYRIGVITRISTVLLSIFNNKQGDEAQVALQFILITGTMAFLIVGIVCWIIGGRMTRTITGAVHHLYQGTQKVMEGDFSHRIEVTGKDQLGELSRSFNRMTENLEQLLVVAKEKERLQSEIEIAQEVQNQLFPRNTPKLRTMRLKAICQAARLVSGDYYDYEAIDHTQVALAIGDVAGKGISAALLMATLQSSLRAQLQTANGNGDSVVKLSTSNLVSRLNKQLYSMTSPEKYATFCLGIYDETSSTLTYTNAGHLPPVLVREGRATRLDVNGTVVGAFPFSVYEESSLVLQEGDLLVCFTDGITEPENEYGEMFGEERLMDLMSRNAHRSEDELIGLLLEGVREWTASKDLQDDMTLLLARRISPLS